MERVAGERIGRQTVEYVSNIYKSYVAYALALDALEPNVRRGGLAP